MKQNIGSKKELLGDYGLVLGIEIHLHVKTQMKMFCGCSNTDLFDAEPNTRVCPVCLGMPGALPVPNKEAVEKTQLLGLALSCEINKHSYFDRKHYFYPDLPKGFQISQYKEPLCKGGIVRLQSGNGILLERIHLEEDTAKSFHEGEETFLDFNKSGVPLIEMVTKPMIYSVGDALEFGREIQEIVRHLGVGDANMEKGQFRVEPNISLRSPLEEKEQKIPEYKVEVKNINSFKFMEKAILSEIKRQKEILDAGKIPIQENRGYDEAKGKTVPQRSKEEAHDYRYFPEPDIPPMKFTSSYIEDLKKELPKLPGEIKKRLISKYDLGQHEADVLYNEELIELFEETGNLIQDYKKVANLLVNRPEHRDKTPEELLSYIAKEKSRIDDSEALQPIIDTVIEENKRIADQVRDGKEEAIEFLIGQVMKKTRGKAAPKTVRELLSEKLTA